MGQGGMSLNQGGKEEGIRWSEAGSRHTEKHIGLAVTQGGGGGGRGDRERRRKVSITERQRERESEWWGAVKRYTNIL